MNNARSNFALPIKAHQVHEFSQLQSSSPSSNGRLQCSTDVTRWLSVFPRTFVMTLMPMLDKVQVYRHSTAGYEQPDTPVIHVLAVWNSSKIGVGLQVGTP